MSWPMLQVLVLRSMCSLKGLSFLLQHVAGPDLQMGFFPLKLLEGHPYRKLKSPRALPDIFLSLVP